MKDSGNGKKITFRKKLDLLLSQKPRRLFSKVNAQTITELAVFGAILIFILGVMIRYSLSTNYSQSQSLKTMRMAMAESFKSSEAGSSSRNFASLIFIEDRLTAEVGKFGGLSRTPVFAASSATFSKNLYLPTDYPISTVPGVANVCNTPAPQCAYHSCLGAAVFEDACCSRCNYIDCNVYPNDPCCVLTGCEAVDCDVTPNSECCKIECPPDFDCSFSPNDPCCFSNGCPFINCEENGGSPCCFNAGCKRIDCNDPANSSHDCCSPAVPQICDPFNEIPVIDIFINGKHFTFTSAGFREYDLIDQTLPHSQQTDGYTIDTPWVNDWDPVCGCRKLYTLVPNLAGDGIENSWDPLCDSCFDLDRNGSVDVLADQKAEFFWQWQVVLGRSPNINLQEGKNVRVDVDGDLKEETIIEMVDIDGVTYDAYHAPRGGRHPIRKVRVLDEQEGDIDGTWSNNEAMSGHKPRPGLQDDIQIYTYTRDGTYLILEEGKDIVQGGSGNQTIRSTQKRNSADIIVRMIQLSNDTGNVCAGNTPNIKQNPDVEVCATNADCFSDANIFKTCFAKDTKMLYVRSKIGELGGRKWLTDLGPRGY